MALAVKDAQRHRTAAARMARVMRKDSAETPEVAEVLATPQLEVQVAADRAAAAAVAEVVAAVLVAAVLAAVALVAATQANGTI